MTEMPTTGVPEKGTPESDRRIERPQHIRYERSGGFAGLVQSLEVLDGERIVVKDRRLGTLPERVLTEGEREGLSAALERIETNPAVTKAIAGDPYLSDGFRVAVYFDGAETPALTAHSGQLPISGAEEWDSLLAWLDALLRSELESTSGSATS